MTSKRLSLIMSAALVVSAIAMAAIGLLGSTLLNDSAESLQSERVEAEVLSHQEEALLQAKVDIEAYGELKDLSRRIIPQEKDQARTVREITNIARETGINITSITFPTSDLGVAPRSTARGAATSEPAEPVRQGITQAKPVPNIPGVLELEISVAVTDTPVEFERMILFLERLEQNRRTSQVQRVAIFPEAENRDLVSFNIGLAVYINP
jgi:hypothetical protein